MLDTGDNSDTFAAYSGSNDFILAISPATVLFKLQMSRKRKLAFLSS